MSHSTDLSLHRFLLLAVLLAAIPAAAQSAYDAERAPLSLAVGGSFSFFDAAYSGYKVVGAATSIDFSPLLWDHLAGEAEGRWLTLNASRGFAEYNYLAGPVYRITLSEHRGLHPYVKGLIGEGVVDFPNHLAYGRYFVVAPGGGVDMTLNQRWRLRADYEYQVWPQAPGIPGWSGGIMKPNGASVGFTYRVF
jgi:opacity protein-like surface antigen